MRHLLLGGEAVPSELVDELQTLTSAQVHNMYGPTETTIWSTTYAGECGPQTMPIGKPLANQRVYVLDKQSRPYRWESQASSTSAVTVLREDIGNTLV